jgi:hypothetical protein
VLLVLGQRTCAHHRENWYPYDVEDEVIFFINFSSIITQLIFNMFWYFLYLDVMMHYMFFQEYFNYFVPKWNWRYDITEILLKVTLNTIVLNNNWTQLLVWTKCYWSWARGPVLIIVRTDIHMMWRMRLFLRLRQKK